MAKACMIARDKVREKASRSAWKNREALKKVIKDQTVGYDEKMAAVARLNKRPRDESPSRVQRRCQICGRPHAVYRKFGLCRCCLRLAAMFGAVPGLVKSSW